MSRIFAQRTHIFRQSIRDIIVDLLWDPTLCNQLDSLSHPSQYINLLLNLFSNFNNLYFNYLLIIFFLLMMLGHPFFSHLLMEVT